jgi:hypothetical protein
VQIRHLKDERSFIIEPLLKARVAENTTNANNGNNYDLSFKDNVLGYL